MSDNPFAEPDDDRTVFRPMPGGKRGPARPPPPEPAPSPPPQAGADPGSDLQVLAGAFGNTLVAAAQPLLQLLARLRNAARPPDQGDMRDRTARELREFERRARDAGVPMEQVRPAHYALCASLDDVVLHTPWGASGSWRDRTLAATFHQDTGAGAGFFDQIRLMRPEPAKHVAVLELMYLCMALGFMGPYRGAPDGAERMDRIRNQTWGLIAEVRGKDPGPLAEHWMGIDAPYRRRRVRFPVWVGAAIVLAAASAVFVWVLDGLNTRSDALLAQAGAAPPASMPKLERPVDVRPPPPPPEPPPPGPAERLREALGPEIARAELEVLATPSATVVRIADRTLFAPGTATLLRGRDALLRKVGAALKAEAAHVEILGYSDDQPVRTVKFPSAFALTKAQAEAVRNALGDRKLVAEGRAGADPVGPNASADDRERNRRIDIVVTK